MADTGTISIEQAEQLRQEILHPMDQQSASAASALLDRWFEAVRSGELAFAPGVQQLLQGLRPPRRH